MKSPQVRIPRNGFFVVVGIAVVGTILLTRSHAATPFIAAEPEQGTISTPAVGVGDTTASGGSAVKFTTASSGGCPAGQVGTPPNCFSAPPAPLAAGKHWTVPYYEEFSGSNLDLSKLSPCFDWNYGDCTSTFNNGKERYLPSQVQVSGGTAKLVAEPLSPPYASSGCYNGSCTYKAGLISTSRPNANNGQYLFPFTYGYVESRMKYPGVPGFFTAFWMLPTDPTYDYQYEIDIVEILGGYPDTVFMTNHYNGRTDSYEPNTGLHNNGACPVKDYSKDWVRFGMDWTPSHVAWYIDGVKCGEYAGSDIPAVPMQIILHMMIDNNWERSWGSVLANQTLVNQLEVDYLRVYQQQP